jgi:RNA polymerase sigma-70 factor (family 1)
MLSDKEFNQIFREHYKPMILYASRYVPARDAAKDIVHDVFLNLWKMKDDFNPRGSMKSYLFSAVYYKSLNYIKHEKQNITASEIGKDITGDFNVYCMDQASFFKDQLFTNETINLVKDIIYSLPDQCRRVFILSRKIGLKNREIAEYLGISIKVVEKHLSKALSILRDNIKNDYL